MVQEFRERVKLMADKMKEESVYRLLENDLSYQKDCEAEGQAEAEYLKLDLTDEQRAVCNELLECRDGQNLEYSTYAYIAGMYDSFRMFYEFNPDKFKKE